LRKIQIRPFFLTTIPAQVKPIIEGKAQACHGGDGPGAAAHAVLVDAESSGQRLDNFLLRQLKGVPKSHVYRIIRSGEVRVNKARAAASTRVAAGDSVRLPPLRRSRAAQEQGARAVPARAFTLLWEDAHLLAIDKPAGLAVHGGSGLAFGVIEQLRQWRSECRFLELVHRLDRETSGVLLVAKKRSALTQVQAQFRQRSTDKTYLALVQGAWPGRHTVIDQPLHKYLLPDGERRVRPAAADDPAGQRAITLVRVRAPLSVAAHAMTLLEVRIKTGRTHQIRVHLANAGHPIAGDDKYGDFALNRHLQKNGLKRMFLHAWRLRLQHPDSGAPVHLHAPLPEELARWIPAAVGDTPDAPPPL